MGSRSFKSFGEFLFVLDPPSLFLSTALTRHDFEGSERIFGFSHEGSTDGDIRCVPQR